MSNRSTKFAAALVASLLASASFTAVAQTAAKPADSCLPGPKGTAPAGSHWYYHLDRGTKKQCWYIGEAKNKAAKTATAQQQTAPDASAADATQAEPAMRKSVADAHAEVASPPATGAAAVSDASNPATETSAAPAPAAATAPPSPVTARWFDASSMGASNGTRLPATAAPPVDTQAADATPQAITAAPAAAATVEAPAEKTSSSTQMLLIVMVGALALAALVSALVIRLTRTRSSPYEIRDEWRAPWDSTNSEPPISPRRERPIRLADQPLRHADPPIPRRQPARDPEPTEDSNRQVTEMLQRLARSAAN